MRVNGPASKSSLTFFLLVFALSIPFWLAGSAAGRRLLRNEVPFGLPLSALQAVNPMLAALVLVYAGKGRAGARELLRRAFDYGRIKRGTAASGQKAFGAQPAVIPRRFNSSIQR